MGQPLKVKKEDNKLNIYRGNKFKDIKIKYIEQKELLGTAHAVSVVEDKVRDEFLVINGDLIVSSDFIDDLVKKHRAHKSSATLSLRHVEDPSGFGMVELNRQGGHIIKNIIEKPKIETSENSKSYLVNAGVYIFNENIFKAIQRIRESESVEYDLPKAINVLTKEEELNLVHGFVCGGMWMSIRRPWDLLDANEILLKNMNFQYLFSWDNVPGDDNDKLMIFLKDEFDIDWAENAEICKSNDDTTINISKDAKSVEIFMDAKEEKATLKISDGRTHDLKVKKEDDKLNLYKFHNKGKIEDYAVVKGDVYIGENTVIKSGAYIESVDEKGNPLPCYIGSNTEVRPGSHIKGPCYIGDNCIIGPNCFIRPHTSLGDWVHIGNAVDLKNSIVMSNTLIAHLAYVADSIIGEGCNLDAGTKIQNLECENLKLSKFSVITDNIRVKVMHEFVNSRRSKFGAILGDGVKTGINVSIMPGVSIYPEAWIEAGCVVRNPIYTEGENL